MKINKEDCEQAIRDLISQDCYDTEDVLSRASIYIVDLLCGKQETFEELKKEIMGRVSKEELEIV